MGNVIMSQDEAILEPGLVRKLLLRHHPDQRYGNDAIVAATELLRLFIVEARQRASIEVSKRKLPCLLGGVLYLCRARSFRFLARSSDRIPSLEISTAVCVGILFLCAGWKIALGIDTTRDTTYQLLFSLKISKMSVPCYASFSIACFFSSLRTTAPLRRLIQSDSYLFPLFKGRM